MCSPCAHTRPCHLLPASLRGAADRPARAVWIAPTPRHSLPRPHPLPWISLSRARQLPSPPSTNRSATGLRTPPRRTKKFRRRPLRCLRQATRAEKPCSIVPVLIFNLRPPATSPWIRGLQCVPDLIDYAIEFTVSSFPFPLLFFACSRATAPPRPRARAPPSAMAAQLPCPEPLRPNPWHQSASGGPWVPSRPPDPSLPPCSPAPAPDRAPAAVVVDAAVVSGRPSTCHFHHPKPRSSSSPTRPAAQAAVAGNSRPAIAAVHCLASAINRRLTRH